MKNRSGFDQYEAFERQIIKFSRGRVNRGFNCFCACEVVDVTFRKLDKRLCLVLADDIIGAVITQRREEWNSNFTNLTVHRNFSQTIFPTRPQKRWTDMFPSLSSFLTVSAHQAVFSTGRAVTLELIALGAQQQWDGYSAKGQVTILVNVINFLKIEIWFQWASQFVFKEHSVELALKENTTIFHRKSQHWRHPKTYLVKSA